MKKNETIINLEKKIQSLKEELGTLYQQQPKTPIQNYQFEDHDRNLVTLAELFNGKQELIIMFNMGRGCPYCTLWADGYNGFTDHLLNRAGFAVVSPDPPEIQKEFYQSRGWRFPMVSHYQNNFAKDFGYKLDGENYLPGVATFSKDESGQLYFHVTSQFGPGDNFCSQWDFLRMLPDGENNWAPKYHYDD